MTPLGRAIKPHDSRSGCLTTIDHPVRLKTRPIGVPTRNVQDFTTEPVPESADGGVFIETLAISLDPRHAWLDERSKARSGRSASVR